jgi:hypothetical protein
VYISGKYDSGISFAFAKRKDAKKGDSDVSPTKVQDEDRDFGHVLSRELVTRKVSLLRITPVQPELQLAWRRRTSMGALITV